MRQKKNGTGVLNTRVSLAVLQGIKGIAVREARTLQWVVEDALAQYLEGGGGDDGHREDAGVSKVVVGVGASTQTREEGPVKTDSTPTGIPRRPFDPKMKSRYTLFATDRSWAGVANDRETGQWFLVIRGRGTEYEDRAACLRALAGMEES